MGLFPDSYKGDYKTLSILKGAGLYLELAAELAM